MEEYYLYEWSDPYLLLMEVDHFRYTLFGTMHNTSCHSLSFEKEHTSPCSVSTGENGEDRLY